MKRLLSKLSVLPILVTCSASMPTVAADLSPLEDVMTSPFFTGTDLVRGYAGDNRNVLRVSSDDPFGLTGAETMYIAFDFDASVYAGPVKATLSLQSTNGGFNANAGPGNPFLVSAHGVDADPFATIADNSNPGGSVDWLTFYESSILDAEAAARTSVAGFGTVQIDVSGVVNSWIADPSAIHVLAITGRHDTSGSEFLHGFLDNSTNPGATVLSITAVPEPEQWALLGAGLSVISWRVGSAARRQRSGTKRR